MISIPVSVNWQFQLGIWSEIVLIAFINLAHFLKLAWHIPQKDQLQLVAQYDVWFHCPQKYNFNSILLHCSTCTIPSGELTSVCISNIVWLDLEQWATSKNSVLALLDIFYRFEMAIWLCALIQQEKMETWDKTWSTNVIPGQHKRTPCWCC